MKLYHKDAYFLYYQKLWLDPKSIKDGIIFEPPRDKDYAPEKLLRIDGHGTFKEAPDLWEHHPQVIAQRNVKTEEQQLSHTQIVHLSKQGLIMRIITVGCWVQFTFYEENAPYEQKMLKHNMKTEGRVMLVNDLRTNDQKQEDDIYVVRHEGQDMRVVKMKVDCDASHDYFDVEETTLKNNHWIDYWKGLVNSYIINGNIFLFLIADRVMVCDQQFNYLDIFQLELGQLRCCAPAQGTNGTQFLLGFFRSDRTYIAGISWRKLRKKLRDPKYKLDSFMAKLSKEETIKLYELV